MSLEQFIDPKVGTALTDASGLAARQGSTSIRPEHLLAALLEDKQATELLTKAGGDVQSLREALRLGDSRQAAAAPTSLYISRDLERILNAGLQISRQLNRPKIDTASVLAAMSMAVDTQAGGALRRAGFTVEALPTALGGPANQPDEGGHDPLAAYCIDLTAMAHEGEIDPVIGRDEEIRRVIQVLTRRTKNNPVLIGEAGVGKTAIVEGLAQRIVAGEVPEDLSNRRVMSLDIGSLIAGAGVQGEFEKRLKSVIDAVTNAEGEIILFIDEIHLLVGVGRSQGAMDAANLVKPYLARGKLHCVGATTLEEYRRYVEKDAALTRRLQPLYVNEPSIEDTLAILRGIKERYETHHGIKISDKALVASTRFAKRYLTERRLPDAAIDLTDEAASRVRMRANSKPEALEELDRKILQLRIERQALQEEDTSESKERREEIARELDGLNEQSDTLTAAFRASQHRRTDLTTLMEKFETARRELVDSQRAGDLERAGQLAYGTMPELEKAIAEKEGRSEDRNNAASVSPADIAEVVANWTGIPVNDMMDSEQQRLLEMESVLAERVIGQEEAIDVVSRAMRRSRAGIQDPKRPLGSFLFLGSTGVGKTELVKTLAQFLFNDENAVIRFDMSEYQERHSVSRLVGAPPGYIGYDDAGQLTEAVRRRPYSIVLLDEVEKAHPEVFNLLLQVLDEGRLTDNQGRTVDFKNTVLIMTSNLGAAVGKPTAVGFNAEPDSDETRITDAVLAHFRPEFLNRIDEQIVFNLLSREHMTGIVDVQLKRVQDYIQDRNITLEVNDTAHAYLAKKGFNPDYGARPLRRVIQREIQDALADLILAGGVTNGDVVTVTVSEGALVIEPRAQLRHAS